LEAILLIYYGLFKSDYYLTDFIAAILADYATYELVFVEPMELRLFWVIKVVAGGLYYPPAEKLLGLLLVMDDVAGSDKVEGPLTLVL
jgi:hypothetical protein